MKKTTILALFASLFVGSAIAEPVAPTWEYPQSQLWYEWTQGGSGQFGDINNDGNLDLLLSSQDRTVIYEANGGWYGNKITEGFGDLRYGDSNWIDYNNDGNLDFIIIACTNTGDPYNTSSVSLYKNVDGTSFVKDEENSAVLAEAKVYVPNANHDNMELQFHRVASGDFNNDGWVDVIISGEPASGYDHWRLTKLFWNNNGTFEADQSGAIEQVNNNGTFVADFDNDGFMDFVVGGYADTAGKQVTGIYFSNGDKTFTQLYLDGCQAGNLLVTDVNNDSYQDILVSGYGAFNGIGLFVNNGDRTFTYKSRDEIGLSENENWQWSSCRSYMVAGDLNNDGYNDIVTHSKWDGTAKYTQILLNNGDCTFTRNTNHNNIAVRNGGVSIFDFNHDGRLDVHAFGYGGENGELNPYYIEKQDENGKAWFNNFMVNTTEAAAYTAPTTPRMAAFEQVEGDVVLTWDAATDAISGEAGIRYNVYAKNLVSGEVSMVAPANIETGALKFTNHATFLNGTSYTFKGMNAADYEFGVQAINNGNVASAFAVCYPAVAEFVPTWTYPQSKLWYEYTQGGSAQFGDFNNDDNLDLLLANQDKTVLYEYNNALYENKIFDGLDDLRYGGIQWLDYNNDGYLDFVMVACTDKNNAKGTSTVSLYKNLNGTGFEKDEANSAILAAAKVYVPVGASVQPGRIACGDFNNDGWIDVVFSGEPADGYDHWRLTKLFWNNQGTFEADTTPIEQVNNNGTYVADLDNDGFMDFIAGGYSDSVGKQVVNVFFSNGDKTFTMETLEHGCQEGSLLIMDADNDGNQDIFVSGYGTDNGIFMHKNNGDRTFTFKSNSEIGLSDSGDGAWGWASCRAYMVAGDLNNDGYNDIVTHCQWDGSKQYTNIALNNGDGTFTQNANHAGASVREGGVSIFDYNHDGRLDVHIYGYGDVPSQHPRGEDLNWFNIIMQNDIYVRPYSAPVMFNTYYEQAGDDVLLKWDAAYDEITGDAGIRYNVYAKNLVSGEVSMVAPANIETGYLKFTNHGSFLNATSYTFKGMIAENYEFGVQAINNGNVAGEFVTCVLNPLTSVEGVEVAATVKVFAFGGDIRIINKGEVANYAVYAVNGMQVAAGNVAANGTVTVNADKGVYIVKAGTQVVKVVL